MLSPLMSPSATIPSLTRPTSRSLCQPGGLEIKGGGPSCSLSIDENVELGHVTLSERFADVSRSAQAHDAAVGTAMFFWGLRLRSSSGRSAEGTSAPAHLLRRLGGPADSEETPHRGRQIQGFSAKRDYDKND